MNRIRRAPEDNVPASIACCRCAQGGGRWDRIAGKAYCPQCQEALALGEAEPLVERTIKNRCSVCDHLGTVCFHTFPLQAAEAVEIDLCPEHLRCLLSRRLGPFAFQQLRRQLHAVGVSSGEIFLLHDTFYDVAGRALHPISELGLAG